MNLESGSGTFCLQMECDRDKKGGCCLSFWLEKQERWPRNLLREGWVRRMFGQERKRIKWTCFS